MPQDPKPELILDSGPWIEDGAVFQLIRGGVRGVTRWLPLQIGGNLVKCFIGLYALLRGPPFVFNERSMFALFAAKAFGLGESPVMQVIESVAESLTGC